jgi:hypothetical protein
MAGSNAFLSCRAFDGMTDDVAKDEGGRMKDDLA